MTLSQTNLEIGVSIIKDYTETLKGTPGVYRMLNAKDEVLYVGKAKNLKNRVTSYTRATTLSNRIQRMVSETRKMIFVTTHTEVEALLLEANLIKKYEPRYNILLRDDKSFAYILIRGDHSFPSAIKHRGAKKIKGAYYGPFASSAAINQTLIALQKIFLLRSCTDSYFSSRKRPCLQYHIKRCSAPCVGFITPHDYKESVKQAEKFMKGENITIVQQLSQKMEKASQVREYEQAAILRDRIKALSVIQAQQLIHLDLREDIDIVAAFQKGGETCIQVFFFRNGSNNGNLAFYPKHAPDEEIGNVLEAFLIQFYMAHHPPKNIVMNHKLSDQSLIRQAFQHKFGYKVDISTPTRGQKEKLLAHALKNAEESLDRHLTKKSSMRKLLEGVQELFSLPVFPLRIEVYDNSHIQGTHPVGGMIVAGADGFQKNAYRKFNIKSQEITPGDDYGMMREVIRRRFQGSLTEKTILPDLLLIDGGAGQLNSVIDVLSEIGLEDIPVVAIAKGPDRNAGRERFFQPAKNPYQLPLNHPVLYYLQTLRDEAHRFAIGAHRSRREKNITQSKLDAVPGIGAKRKKALLQHFGSAKGVEQAGIEDLAKVEGISQTIARQIYDFFHG